MTSTAPTTEDDAFVVAHGFAPGSDPELVRLFIEEEAIERSARQLPRVSRPADPSRHHYVGSSGYCRECGLRLNSPQHDVLPDGDYGHFVVVKGRELAR
jgi:hypothetical protein